MKVSMEKDLFGHPIKKKKTRLERSLEIYDKETFLDRLERHRWLENTLPRGYSFIMPVETFFVKDEVVRSFANGEFVATILLSQAFIEHWGSSGDSILNAQ
jgi:hypothetical protein